MVVHTVHPTVDLPVMVLEQYAAWQRASGVAPSTVLLWVRYLRRLCATVETGSPRTVSQTRPEYPPARNLGEPSLFDSTTSDLVAFLARDDWSPETRKSARAAIRSFYRWAAATGQVDQDPARILPAVRVPMGVPRPTPDDVFRAALDEATGRDALLLMLAAYAGLRRAEIAAVHTADVSAGELRVRGKGGRVRVLPLHPALRNELAQLGPGWVFPSPQGGHLTAGHVGRLLKRLLGQGWSGHTLRHRFGSRAYAVDHDLRAVQTLLGHSSPTTTARYVAVSDASLRRAVAGS